MKDVARRKFKWNEAAVQDNLNEMCKVLKYKI